MKRKKLNRLRLACERYSSCALAHGTEGSNRYWRAFRAWYPVWCQANPVPTGADRWEKFTNYLCKTEV